MMVGNNLKDSQLQQIVDKTILFHDKDGDGKISFQEFCDVCFYFSEILLFQKIGKWKKKAIPKKNGAHKSFRC